MPGGGCPQGSGGRAEGSCPHRRSGSGKGPALDPPAAPRRWIPPPGGTNQGPRSGRTLFPTDGSGSGPGPVDAGLGEQASGCGMPFHWGMLRGSVPIGLGPGGGSGGGGGGARSGGGGGGVGPIAHPPPRPVSGGALCGLSQGVGCGCLEGRWGVCPLSAALRGHRHPPPRAAIGLPIPILIRSLALYLRPARRTLRMDQVLAAGGEPTGDGAGGGGGGGGREEGGRGGG